MSSTIIFSISALCYSLILVVVFFSKKNYDSLENKIYSYLIITTLLGLIIEVSAVFVLLGDNKILSFLQMKGYLIYLITWISLFTLYVVATFKKKIKYLPFGITLYILSIFAIFVLPTQIYNQGGSIYTYGPSINFVYLYSLFCLIVMGVNIIKNFRKLFQRKYLPIPLFILLGVMVLVIQTIYSGLLLISYAEALITFLMYFTIENPDLKVINQLNKNRRIIENTNQNNFNFLFRVITESKKYIKDVDEITNNVLKSNDKESYRQAMVGISDRTQKAKMSLNNIIDISALDIKNIKISKLIYNPDNMFKEIVLKFSNLKKNVEFRTNISQNLPEKLYGDNIRLKQIICSVIENSIKNTSFVFISLDVNTIVMYDICRLIISIEDTGKGLPLTKVNEILSFSGDISLEELEQGQTLDMNLKMVKKLVKLLGGNFVLTSEEKRGTKVTIVVDQLIENEANKDFEKMLKHYNNALDIMNVLVVDDDINELNTIKDIIEAEEIDVVSTMTGNDCLNRIRVGQTFDMIILDDSMDSLNAIEILKQLNLKDIPIIVMLDEQKLSLGNHYLDEGFTDFINKGNLISEIKIVMHKYLK